ncbi:MAG: DUF3006 domain-containing protein [Selenomonas sp.]|uniref:DUF3006 domain-containing protein n=1 Tax=Selenomonas sp. TaxID=2053611 RepID=UPI0025DAB786|nr:DUF3006 domain-containing protein [Selenomonas sp.]MCI6100854.1 DUF3006 domain-containing protein [Selenomonas sp.]MCI6233328.1 DUF3006 domain-containing protein [Selenomonas sp.]
MISAYLDRFEEDKAVLLLGDDMKKCNFPRKYLPDGLNEGDYVKIDIQYDKEATEAAEAEAQALLHDEE